MIRKYRTFSLALVALFAYGVIAQSASASGLTVPAGVSEVHITGVQEGSGIIFTTPNGSISCTTATGDATATPASGQISEITGTATYSGCKAFGFATAHINPNGCTGTGTTGTSIAAGVVTAGPEQLHQLCPAGKSIEITPTTFGVSACTMFIPPQTPTAGHVIGRNVAGSSPMYITGETTLSGIHYTGTGGLCGNSETHSDATITGNGISKCYKNAAHTEQIDCTFS
jgi:hypothetical protein